MGLKILLMLGTIFAAVHTGRAQLPPAAAELEAEARRAVATGDCATLLSLSENACPSEVGDFEVAWRAARAYWIAGDQLYWRWMVDNINAAKPDDVDEVLDAERDLTREQGERLMRLAQKLRRCAERAAALAPQRVEGYYYEALGISLYAFGKSIIAALKEGLRGKFDNAIGTALKLDSGYDEAGPLRIKGRSFFKLPWPLRDYDDSLDYLQRAEKLAPTVALTHLFLGDTQWKLGNRAAAEAAWRKTIELAQPEKRAADRQLAENARIKLALLED